ncbi:aspartic proteinase-like protein 1 isoform X1 [Camellia sinensis]|uniref:aspartic proteinase-like protein 1 isoform X1 n=1 Tax=Camellia sinensis TaxID=4442 RepID=UPI00103668F2|nr:aspartic proteinase-like protein 1 isoform X1 [Camellia sinensis]
MATRCLLCVVMAVLLVKCVVGVTFSSRLIHRFSDELKALRVSRKGGESGSWPERKSMEYYKMLVANDVQRQKMKLGSRYQFLFPSEGSRAFSLGNDFGWLHYTWIDVGTPNVSFLVALDSGSDLLWVPCDCIQCASLSASYYNSLDRDLNEYSPSGSTTSKHLSCSHQLCQLGPNCQSPKQPCPYTVNYYSENTSSSGLLVEDTLHLAAGSDDASNISVQAPVIIGCGRMQSGAYLDGVAPDGLMGLGLGEISVPSFLAKAGLVQNSFSLCFGNDDSGRIFFGDQGPAAQQSTPFLPSDGKYITYIVGVKACCIGSSCLDKTSFEALVDSGTSFTFLPKEAYERVVQEFDRQVNATSASFEGSPWKYCYKSSSGDMPKTPSVAFKFSVNNSFVVHDPVFIIHDNQGIVGFCLAIESTDGDIGTIGQNYMTGYRVVFDRENLKLGWSRSNCQDLSDGKRMPLTPNTSAPNPLPTTEQQSAPSGHAVAPAVAGRTPPKPSAASTQHLLSDIGLVNIFLLLLLFLHPLASGL